MNQFTKQKTFLVCPSCGDDSNSIDHLLTDESKSRLPFRTEWCCKNEKCGKYLEFEIGVNRQVNYLRVSEKPPVKTVYDVLVLPPQKDPVYFVLKTKDYGFSKSETEFRNQHYFYEQHTCPTNWTKYINAIIIKDDDDPHGLFQFVSRKTEDEVCSVINVDSDGDLNNGAGLEFMNSFLPTRNSN